MTAAAFDHLASGTAESRWCALLDELHGRGELDELTLPGAGDHVVVVSAHPDDETLGAGGVIAAASDRGARVTVVVATEGEASHPLSPTHSREQLAALRRREIYAAVAALAPEARLVLLGFPDGRLADYEAKLVAALRPVMAGATHLLTPWEGDAHPDHEACARAGHRAAGGARHWRYPVWAWHWGDPVASPFARCDLRAARVPAAARTAKAKAMACHVSQHRPLSDAPGDEAILSADMLAHFTRDLEVFVVGQRSTDTPPEYFEQLYAEAGDDGDPWGLDARFYEQRKRAALLAALTRPRFARAFEPGCATGLLTAELGRRCDCVVAWDVAGSAIAQTSERVREWPQVSVGRGRIPDDWPEGSFDLIVLSEVGYYCADLDALADRIDASLTEDGILVGCHWRHDAAMHAHTAGVVHATLGADRHLLVSHVEDDFLLQVWSRTARSVAAAEGIVTEGVTP